MKSRIVLLFLAFILVCSNIPDISAAGEWNVLSGYSGGSGSYQTSGNQISMTGTGSASFNQASTNALAVDFQIISYPASGSYSFSMSMVNTPNVYSLDNGSICQGITTKITSFGSGGGLNVGVYKLKASGATLVSTITTNVASLNTTHTLTYYLEDSKWHVTIDGIGRAVIPSSELDFGANQYLCAGSAGVNTIKMNISDVYTDNNVTNRMKGFSEPVGGFSITKGYNSGTNPGLSENGGKITFSGCGYTSYIQKKVTNAAAVEFQLNKRCSTNYWFSISLLNDKLPWNTNGKEANGIATLITAFNDNSGINVRTVNITPTGSPDIATLTSRTGALDTNHTLTFYKDNDTWFICLDGTAKASIGASDVNFGAETYLSVAAYSGANLYDDMKMSVSNVYTDSSVTNSMKGLPEDPNDPPVDPPVDPGSEQIGGFTVIKGFDSGTNPGLTENGGTVTFAGGGFASYTAKPVTNAIAVDFQLNKRCNTGYWFSISLLNDKNSWSNNGKEANGIATLITAFNDDSGINVRTVNITPTGSADIATIVSRKKGMNTTHTLAFFKENDVWYISIDGTAKTSIAASGVQLTTNSYLSIATYTGAGLYDEMKMSVSKIYIDNEVTPAMKAGGESGQNPGSGSGSGSPVDESKAIGGFAVTKGFDKGTAPGISENGGNITFNGAGFASYVTKPVTSGVAVDFQLNKRCNTNYWFSISLLNSKKSWNPNGKEGTGIATLITAFNDDSGINVRTVNLSSTGSTDIGTIVSRKKGMNTTHTLAFFKENDVWYISIDGTSKASVAASNVQLDANSYLSIGMYTGAGLHDEMKMSVSKIYFDSQLTAAMKSGSAVAPPAGQKTAPGTSKSDGGTSYDADGNLLIGEITKGTALEYIAAKNIVNTFYNNRSLIIIILIAIAIVSFVISVVVFLFPPKKWKHLFQGIFKYFKKIN